MKLEDHAIPMYKDAIEYAESIRDYVTRVLLSKILSEEEEHVDYLETQFDLIKQMGIERYITLNSAAANEGE
jgi:bacterioferritin